MVRSTLLIFLSREACNDVLGYRDILRFSELLFFEKLSFFLESFGVILVSPKLQIVRLGSHGHVPKTTLFERGAFGFPQNVYLKLRVTNEAE